MAAIRKQVPQKHLYKLHMQHLYKLWKQTLDLLQAEVYDTAVQSYHGSVQLPGLIATNSKMDFKICFLITISPTGSAGLFDSNFSQLEAPQVCCE